MRSKYDPVFKSTLILDMLQNGRSLDETAKLHHLNKGIVKSWKDKILRSAALIFGCHSVSVAQQAQKKAALLNALGSRLSCKRCSKRNICNKSLTGLMGSF